MAKPMKIKTSTGEWVDVASSTTDLSGYPALATNQFGFRNKIINGDFRINQRGYTSGSNLASGAYGFDRWKSTFTNTTLTFTSAPQGQAVTINSGGSVEQIIERANMPAGTYVLSWTGTATGRVYNTGATPPSYAASPILVTLDGSANVEVEFTASDGTRTLQNVQLEAGSVPSAFEYRPIGIELALCQRYYWRVSGNATNTAKPIGFGNVATTATSGAAFVNCPVPMRVVPTFIETGAINVADQGAAYPVTSSSIVSAQSSEQYVFIAIATAGGLTAFRPIVYQLNGASSFFGLGAEL
jgi:hypothetical protein